MKRIPSILSLCLMGAALVAGVGCAKKLDDAKMSSDIQDKFNQDSGLASKQLTVQANNGVVTLSGTVDNVAQRDAAGRQAATEPGVKTVVNNLQVGDGSQQASIKPEPAVSTPPAEKLQPAAENKASKHAKNLAVRKQERGADDSAQPMVANNQAPPDANPAAAAPADNAPAAPATPPPPPAPKQLIIDQGTQLSIRLVDAIDSEKNQTGDTIHATLNAPLTSDGEQAVPSGVEVVGHLVEVKSAGKFAGQSSVVMQLDSMTAGGKTYSLQTDQYRKSGSSRGKNTAEKVGGGAVIGSIIGALAGGGKGAAIGAAAGAGVGGGVQAASKSQQIKLPSETVLNFTLQAPITVVQVPDAGRPKLSDSQQN